MQRLLALYVLFLLPCFSFGHEIEIGLWQDGKTTNRFLVHSEHDMTWVVDELEEHIVPAGSSTYFTMENGRIRLSTAASTIGFFKTVLSKPMEDKTFNMKSLKPSRIEDIYMAVIKVQVIGKGLLVTNIFADIEPYIAGVVESESGKNQGLEFYKVQAVISRTYALSNSRRHEHEGFNLCDQVHCQVFRGVSRFNTDIVKAAEHTRNQVLVDSDINMITASFHSNCGGHTVNSEEVWTKALPYLRGKRDTFCIAGKHAHWEATILKSSWENYLSDQFSVNLNTPNYSTLDFIQAERDEYFLSAELGIERKILRHKWRLNSTFFNVHDKGDQLEIIGRGFGHGVGLCQEGAMNMAERGFKYDEIMLFYYTDVHLTHRSVIEFFKEN